MPRSTRRSTGAAHPLRHLGVPAKIERMRLWSLHPRYLDRQGLTATWREALLAQAVLAGRTTGYRSHPQLRRFAGLSDPMGAIGAYLEALADEATGRGYRYDCSRIDRLTTGSDGPGTRWDGAIEVTTGQMEYEWGHLVGKLRLRSPDWLAGLATRCEVAGATCEAHPLFRVVEGSVADWEVV